MSNTVRARYIVNDNRLSRKWMAIFNDKIWDILVDEIYWHKALKKDICTITLIAPYSGYHIFYLDANTRLNVKMLWKPVLDSTTGLYHKEQIETPFVVFDGVHNNV